MAVSVNQTIVFWDRKAREMLGYTAHRLVGAKCSEIPSGLGCSGLTPECAGCCACMRYARAGLVPPAVELAMRASWGEVKWLDVRPVVVPWLPDVGTVVVYLFRERGDRRCPASWVIWSSWYRTMSAEPTSVDGGYRTSRDVQAADASRAGGAEAHGAGLGE